MLNSVIIVAAGSGKRMKADINKQYLTIRNKEIIAHTIEVFDKCQYIDEIVVVIKEEEKMFFVEQIVEKYKFNKKIKIAFGGKERQDSVYAGMLQIDEKSKIVLIHDGARPFVSHEIIENAITNTIKSKAVVVGVPVKDTIKTVNINGIIENTLNRELTWAVQTPQVFEKDLLIQAYEKAQMDGFIGTDDASLVERYGYEILMLMGSYDNIKITTQEDIYFGEAILNYREME